MAWWSEQAAGLVGGFGGGGLGALAGTMGALAGFLVPRGIGRPFVVGGFLVFIVLGVAALLVGAYAVIDRQPYHVFYPLLLIGFVLTAVMTPLFFVMRKQYRYAEERKLESAAIRRG